MTPPYSVTWLEPEDAAAAARVEAAAYPAENRSGSALIAALLTETALDGRNYSMALRHGRELVGYAVIVQLESRIEVSEYFDAPVPAGADVASPVLYIPEYVVLPAHRRKAALLGAGFTALLRARTDLRRLDLVGFSSDEYLRFWSERDVFFRRLGWRMLEPKPYADTRLARRMHWLDFEPLPQTTRTRRASAPRSGALEVGAIRAPEEWRALEDAWTRLHHQSARPAPERGFEHLYGWWSHVEVLSPLYVVAAFRGERLVAALPLRIATEHCFGYTFRRLGYIGGASPADTPGPICAPDEPAAYGAIAQHIAHQRGSWDALALLGTAADDPFRDALREALRAHGHLVSTRRATYAARAEIPVARFLAAGCDTQAGDAVHVGSSPAEVAELLLRHAELEDHAHIQGQPALDSSGKFAFLHGLAAQAASPLRAALLVRNGRDVAGIVGMLRDGCLWVRSAAWQSGTPPAAARAALAQLVRATACEWIAGPADFLDATGDPGARVVDLYATPRSPRGTLLHAGHAIAKPLIWSRAGASP